MLNQVLAKVFGSKHERDVKRMQPVVEAVDALDALRDVLPLLEASLQAHDGWYAELGAQVEALKRKAGG